MLFIDSNGIRNRYYLNKKTNELSDEIDYYKKEINNLELERKAFDKNDKLLVSTRQCFRGVFVRP